MRLYTLSPMGLTYAETHFSFRLIPSRLRRDEPEVVVDVPHRLNPGENLPLLVLVKDAHLHPVKLLDVEVELETAAHEVRALSGAFEACRVEFPWWHTVISVPRPAGVTGPCLLRVALFLEVHGEHRSYVSDNYRLSSHAPLRCYFAEEPLPAPKGWYFGDLHFHSSYTSDQVEFGAPLAASVQMAKALGLRFFAVTDHSYDLDDSPEDPLRNDHTLPKWHQLRAEVRELNALQSDVVIIPGEELSCGNRYRRNVHLLVLDNPEFLPGAGDSAERWLRTAPELLVSQALERLHPEALAFAAHPEDPTPPLQWLLIRRGRWTRADYGHPRLNGMQLLNGHAERAASRTLRRWVELLLAGKRLSIVAGNDGHGNFARFRQIGLPFLSMREHCAQIFGVARTGVQLEGRVTLANLKAALRQGRNVVTTGPFMELRAEASGQNVGIGGTAFGSKVGVFVDMQSTPEFGRLQQAVVCVGSRAANRERPVWQNSRFPAPYHNRTEFTLQVKPGDLYLRGELHCSGPGGRRSCYTNPLWLSPSRPQEAP